MARSEALIFGANQAASTQARMNKSYLFAANGSG